MNCALCHDVDTSRYLASTSTLLFGEADLLWNDLSGMVGPRVILHGMSNAFSYRHRNATHFLFTDIHLEQVKRAKALMLHQSKRFWLPTSNDSYGLSGGLPYP